MMVIPPSTMASLNGHIEVVQALLEAGAGADIRRLNEEGWTPISDACYGKHMEVFRALVEAGGDEHSDSNGYTALNGASLFGLTEESATSWREERM